MIRRLSIPISLALLFLLPGCSSTPSEPQTSAPSHSWMQQQQWLEGQQHWQINGKIGIRQGQELTAAAMSWTQQSDRYHIFMSGPMGQGAIDIKGSHQNVTMQISGEGIYFASSPEELLEQRLGWSLPIGNLLYWIKGLPAPGTAHQKSLDQHNRLETLEQNNWQIRYHSYRTVEDGNLPGKIVLRQGKKIRVTLIIKEWNLNPPAG
ncbi:MAG: lipoprotein insertase outer membrane protein LolB [Motiliproteus sp.]